MTMTNCSAPDPVIMKDGNSQPIWLQPDAVADPRTMVDWVNEALDNTRAGGIYVALDIIRRAKALYPNSFNVERTFLSVLSMVGHISMKIGADEMAIEQLGECVAELDALHTMGLTLDSCLNHVESAACMELGELIARRGDDNPRAFELLNRTDWSQYPYAAVLCFIMKMDDKQRYGREMANDIRFIAQAVESDAWRNPFERGVAYYVMALFHCKGIPGVAAANVSTAFACLKKCAETDPELAERELKKYSRNLFGKLVYRG